MSAYVVGPETINRITSGLMRLSNELGVRAGFPSLSVDSPADATLVGRELLKMNREAVNQRYGKDKGEPAYDHAAVAVTDVQLFKSVQCLAYQCSEGDVPERDLYKQLEAFSDWLAHRIVSRTPEYEASDWA